MGQLRTGRLPALKVAPMPIRDRLTDLKCRSSKPSVKTQRLWDGAGLYLEISPAGGKWWRFKYRLGDKERRISMGVYPEVTLKDARTHRDVARKQLEAGNDPSLVKKAKKAAATLPSGLSFEEIGREWVAKQNRWSESHREITLHRLEMYVFPWIGRHPIGSVSAPELLAALQRIEDRGAVESAHRVHQICSRVFLYAMAGGRAGHNPAAHLRGALSPVNTTHLAALTNPAEVGQLLTAIDGYAGNLITRCALRLAPLLFVRPGELRHAEWAEIDLESAEWNIPAEKMKMREPHLVPLAQQAINLFKELQPLTGKSNFVFPSIRTFSRPMSENTILAALRTLGYTKDRMTGHGFRAMARTMIDEKLGIRPDIIEHQLAHQVKDPLGRAYNRTQHLSERRRMMQAWADYLDKLRTTTPVQTASAA